MNAASPSHTSFEDYLVGEASGDVKHEWCDGVVYAMSRGTPEHARLTMRIARSIGAGLEKGCGVYSSNLCGDALCRVSQGSNSGGATTRRLCSRARRNLARAVGRRRAW
jgi:hypothetical protein